MTHGWNSFASSDASVTGEIDFDTDHKTAAIYEWSSHRPGQGNTLRALNEIRVEALKVFAIGVGYPGDESYSYWQHLLDARLIDGAEDDDGVHLTKLSP